MVQQLLTKSCVREADAAPGACCLVHGDGGVAARPSDGGVKDLIHVSTYESACRGTNMLTNGEAAVPSTGRPYAVHHRTELQACQ